MKSRIRRTIRADGRVEVKIRIKEPLRRLIEQDAKQRGISMHAVICGRLEEMLDARRSAR